MKKTIFFLLTILSGFWAQAQSYPLANFLVTLPESRFGTIVPNPSNLILLHGASGYSLWRLKPNDKGTPAGPNILIHPGSNLRYERLLTTGATSGGGSSSTTTINVSNVTGLGTAALRDVPISGNANSSQVLLGSDTRLTNSRTPTSHTHVLADVTGAQSALDLKVPTSRTIDGGSTISGGGNLGSNLSLAVIPNTTIQKIEFLNSGSLVGTRKGLNVTTSGDAAITLTDDPTNDRVNLNISATAGSGTMPAPSGTGLVVQDGVSSTVTRSITSSSGISITNGSGVVGNINIAPSSELAGVQALTATGPVSRTGSGTYSAAALDLGSGSLTGTLAAARMPAITGDISISVGTTTSSYNGVVPSNKGGAGTINGLIKANGSGTTSLAVSGVDYLAPTGSAASLTSFPTLNQNTTGTAANLSGTPALPSGTTATTQSAANSTTLLATTAFVTTADNLKANIASPTFTGTPAAPTAAIYTNTTQIASTAFVNTIAVTKLSYKTITEVRAFTATDVTNNPRVWITDSGKEGEFRYNAGSSASDNIGTVLVTTSGSYRYERIVSGSVYPEWFGAVGDGSTYDTTPIQNALNYAATIGTGAVVQLGAKNYKITTLIMPDSVKLIGFNAKLTQVRANGTAVPVITCGNKNEIDGLNIVCHPVDTTYTNNGGIYVFNKTNVTIKDCYIKNHGIYGIMVDRCKNVSISNNRFWTNYQMSNLLVNHGTWTNSTDIYIYTNGGGTSENVLIHGNRCNSPFTCQGIWVNGAGYEKDIIISDNICATTNEDGTVWTATNYWLDTGSGFIRRHGILASYQSTATSGSFMISGNICKTTLVTGIYVSGVGDGKGINVVGNICIENGYTTNSDRSLAGGVAITGATGLAQVVGNQIIDFKANSTVCGAINVQRNLDINTAHNVYIADNVIINSAGVGYRIQTSSDNVTIAGGMVRNSGLNDIFYDNFVSTSNIDNWLRIKDLTIIRNNITSRSVYVDAVQTKKIEISGVSIKSIDSTTNNGANFGICIINPYAPILIKNCIFDNIYQAIFIPTGGLTGRFHNIIISNNFFNNLTNAVFIDSDYPNETFLVGTGNRYSNMLGVPNGQISYKSYHEGDVVNSNGSFSITVAGLSISTGSWVVGDKLTIDIPTATNPYQKVCAVSGTFGTLSGVTGGITAGTKTLTVNSATNLRRGMFINIVGVTGTKKIVSVSGTTITIDSNVNTTVSGAAVSYQTPSLITSITLP